MAKDYFQDILPPQGGPVPKPASKPQAIPQAEISVPLKNESPIDMGEPEASDASRENARSIRNITVSSRPSRRTPMGDMREAPTHPTRPPRILSRWWIWIAAGVSVAILGILLLVATRPTTVTVTPRSQIIVFDASSEFSAYPGGSAPTGMLTYTVETLDFEDSAVVTTTGTERVDEKAHGKITVVNNYSSTPVKLIKNTRFETPDGLIFRILSEVNVPGKKGTKPGELSVEVFADASGEKYNVGPIARFTLPGLKNSSAMYADVYARSSEGMVGGFVGERPVIDPVALQSAKAEIRGRLAEKVRADALSRTNETSVVLPDLALITYTTLPSTEEAGGAARIHEKVRVEMPIFPAEPFARTIARGISADAEEGSVMVKGIPTLTATSAGADVPILGSNTLNFTLAGSAQLIWNVDTQALGEALAGRGEDAFQAIVGGFPGVEGARARVQPFWKNSFPENSADIHINIEEPALPSA